MSLGPESVAVNDQLLTTPTRAQYFPGAWGPQTSGVPQVSPSYPPFLGGPTSAAPGAESVGGYGTAGNNATATAVAGAHPWNMRVSPTGWAVIGLVGSLLLLKGIHWRDTMLEGAEEHGGLGPFSERAEERVG